MFDPIVLATKAYWIGFYLLQHATKTVMTGDKEELIRIFLLLAIGYVLLLMFGRVIRAIYGTFVFMFKFAMVCAAAYLGMNIYVNGWQATADALAKFVLPVNFDTATQFAVDLGSQFLEQNGV